MSAVPDDEGYGWVRDGALVWYQSAPGPDFCFAGVVDGEPWRLGDHSWCVNLREMEPRYRNGERTRVNAAYLGALRPRPACCPHDEREPLRDLTGCDV